MKFTKEQKLISAIFLQIFIIIAIVIFKLSILSGGTEILLQIEPVDPRDYLRGDYITFQYSDISRVSIVKTAYSIRNGDDVFVELKKKDNFWEVYFVSKNKPTGDKPFIKGKVINGEGGLLYSTMQISYGVEQYFIPEGKGAGVNFGTNAYAKVMVDDDGNAVLKQVYIDGKPWP